MLAIVIFCGFISFINGHGFLQEPPARSSMWRFGYNTPHNYNDNQLFCGGFDRQWARNNGQCGICGDPWDGVRENEAGGKYATGIISRRYTEGQMIDVKVKITASHYGYFEFRLCPNNNVRKPATQECLDRFILRQPSGNIRFRERGYPQLYSLKLQLPKGLTCSQCVLQWKYNAGNSYGIGPDGRSCRGCGHQEQFYGCADIAIDSSSPEHYYQGTTYPHYLPQGAQKPNHVYQSQNNLNHYSGNSLQSGSIFIGNNLPQNIQNVHPVGGSQFINQNIGYHPQNQYHPNTQSNGGSQLIGQLIGYRPQNIYHSITHQQIGGAQIIGQNTAYHPPQNIYHANTRPPSGFQSLVGLLSGQHLPLNMQGQGSSHQTNTLTPAGNIKGSGFQAPYSVQNQMQQSHALENLLNNVVSAKCEAKSEFRAVNPLADLKCQTLCKRGFCPVNLCNRACHFIQGNI